MLIILESIPVNLKDQKTPRIVGDDSARSEPTEVADSNNFKPLLKEKRLKEQTLTQTDEEAVKESEKGYIGMVKICYEGAQRSKQERPGEDVVGNSRGTAWIKEPQAFAKISVEVGDALDGTPRKKSRTASDLVLVWKATWKRQPRRTRGELEEQDLNN
ncbi:hypothetical protein Tco_0190886 [Tanacetum coccineum]